MPSIIIDEKDLTKGGEASTNYNVVYVPGFSNGGSATAETPVLCTTIAEFEEHFGKTPYKFEPTKEDTEPDLSYIYAKELISLGLPVLYESVNAGSTNNVAKQLLANRISAEDGLFDKLLDKGEYQFKFLTSGGYPLFTENSTSSGDAETTQDIPTVEVTDANFPESTDVDSTKTYKFKLNTSNKWELFEVTTVTTEEKTQETDISKNKFFTGTLVNETTYVISKTDTTNDGVLQSVVFLTVTLDKYNVSIGDTIKVEVPKGNSLKGTYAPVSAVVSNSAYLKATSVAASRGDCIVLIDHDDVKTIDELGKVYDTICEKAKTLTNSVADQCAMFTPWVDVECPTYVPGAKEDIVFSMPGSFAYLAAFANSIKNNPSWLAVAGASRGQVPNLKKLSLTETLSNSVAESFQNRGNEINTKGVSINAITNIKPFGNRIWGNRTLKDNSLEKGLTATSFLNTRNMICDVKKVVYEACRRYTFEQNNDVLWLNFKAYIEPTLNQMKTGAGLSGYKIIKVASDGKAKLNAQIKLFPLYAVEDFTIEVQMLDEEIAVS